MNLYYVRIKNDDDWKYVIETNERMAKINDDTNRSLLYMMDNQCKMVDNVEIIKKDLMNIKSDLRQP